MFSFVFGGCPKCPFSDNLAKKEGTPKITIKIGVSARHFLKNRYASWNGRFWTKKSQIQKFQLSFFVCLFFFSSNKENIKISWNPYFYSVLANLKTDKIQNLNLKHKNNLHLFLKKKGYFEKIARSLSTKKTHNDNWAKKHSLKPQFL